MIVIDTHIWVKWIMEGGQNLPASIADRIEHDEQVCISAISCLETSWLVANGKLELPVPLQQWLYDALLPAGIEPLPVNCEIARCSVELPWHHKDPADRIIIATAIVYKANLASLDTQFPHYQDVAALLV